MSYLVNENNIQIQKASLRHSTWFLLATLGFGALVACSDDDGSGSAADEPYVFTAEDTEQSSVATSGQILRHVLIKKINNYIADLTDRIDSESYGAEAGTVSEDLNFFFEFDSNLGGSLEPGIETDLPLLQQSLDDISTDKDLVGKLAGNDEKGQHKDWSTAFVGFEADDVDSPQALITHLFTTLDELAVARNQGDEGTDPDGAPLSKVYVTEQGVDVQQLIEKFLAGAIAFSQATDDYLDNDLEDHGLNASHGEVSEGENYTALEHHWDEAFGYFGAARDYPDYTDDEIAGAEGRDGWAGGYHDSNGDGQIDLLTEYNFGHSQNAAKRDRGSVVKTDFTQSIFAAFVQGRALLASTVGSLSESDRAELLGYRDTIVLEWEKVIAATVVHYLNEVIQDTLAIGSEDYDFYGHAKHWSEAKGFALVLQFSRFSPLSDEDFAALHEALGAAPVLAQEEAVEYQGKLNQAKALMQVAYGFDPQNMGDNAGLGGW